MKTLQNHVILYDADCPMCKLYTKAFIKTGMLDVSGRQAYQQVSNLACPVIDRQRAVNEVALINNITGEVSYGIHSLFKVIGNSFPVLKPLFLFKPFAWMMARLYAFISYNRRIIIPARITDPTIIQPAFRLDYRVSYLFLTWLCTSIILSAYARLLAPAIPVGAAYREFFICSGQVIFQGLMITVMDKTKSWDYLGNMMTISFAGALMLLPALLLIQHYHLSPTLAALFFMFVAGLMFLEHLRRTRLLGIQLLLTVSWVSYRIILLLLILNFN